MERFKHVVFFYSGRPGERGALGLATAFADNNRAKISVLAVDEEVPGVAQVLLGKGRVEQLTAARRHALQSALDADLRRLGREPVGLHFRSGSSAIETIRFILSEGGDLLLKVRETPEPGRSIANTDKKLLRKCPVPVLLLNQSRKKNFSRILAAVDPDPTDLPRLELHRNVVAVAASLAKYHQATLDIVYAWDTFSPSTLQGPRFKLTMNELRALAAVEQKAHQAWLNDLLAANADMGVKCHQHLIQGEPSQVIVDLAGRRKSDLLVMGTVARGGLPGLLIGNTAEKVLDNVGCSTLTIKPADFLCPISV
jgi:nucleotide-binding universal stress UspA family protein